MKVTYLPWGKHLGKLDAALAAGKAPDVTEMGNTEMTKYMAAGAFSMLSASSFDNSKTWLGALQQSARFGGKLYGVPYYASARAAIVRTDYWKGAGVSKLPPTTLGEFYSDGLKLMEKYGKKDPNFSALYFPGQNWYAATSWVYDFGGSIAVRSGGAWKGNLNSPKSIAGPQRAEEGRPRPVPRGQDGHRGQRVDDVRSGPRRLDDRQRLGSRPDHGPEGR